MGLLVLLVLILLLIAAVPAWPYSHKSCFYRVDGIGAAVLIVLILIMPGLILGRF